MIDHEFGSNNKIAIKTIAMPIVAHEIGHFIGLFLNNICIEPFGIATIINFGRQNPRLSFDWTDQVFRVLRHETPNDFMASEVSVSQKVKAARTK
ncbi:hypothetical protein [Pedobacter miscanthi]|uniref:hypothetical protein n=1 Tax=Pedobacter miscanthi TaxID=2259170 RepID=UPI00292CCB44|nr:hypothetical protein [Pedobacter miscanthi]